MRFSGFGGGFWRVFGVLKKRAIVCNCCLQISEIPLWKWNEKWELIEISVEFILKWKGLNHIAIKDLDNYNLRDIESIFKVRKPAIPFYSLSL